MHPKISVVCPSRHRPEILAKFIECYWKSLEHKNFGHPILTILHDAPKYGTCDRAVFDTDISAHEVHQDFRSVWVPEKSSLTELFNLGIMLTDTDWVFIAQDDIEFKKGWLEYLEKTIDTGNYDLIHLFHYGAMAFHKSLILKVGWFDERFRGGGYEDNDYQLRISEAGLKDRVDRSHDFIKRENGKEIGHFVDHTKYVYNSDKLWKGENNAEWIKEKWCTHLNWKQPCFRKFREVDWHPMYTMRYKVKYSSDCEWLDVNENSIADNYEVYH